MGGRFTRIVEKLYLHRKAGEGTTRSVVEGAARIRLIE